MVAEVKNSVDIRVNFFDQYYTVPLSVKADVDAFITELNALGESCTTAVEFEEKFAATGLSDKFNALLPRCTPKAVQMTAEQKQYSKEVAKEIFKEDRERIVKEEVGDVAESITMAAESELSSQIRRDLSDVGLLDDVTRASNAVEMAKDAAGFLGGLFKKKKK